jgi:tripartite-type tricarboxylate transporter receptor subunit TctC
MTRTLAVTGLLALIAAGAAAAQPYPGRPVRVIVAQSAGSSIDTITRIVAPRVSDMLGQQLVLDNRGGAAGIIGLEIAARATPDGYTLAASGSSAMVNSRFTYRQLAFDALKDFSAISLYANAESMLVVHPGVPARSVKELIALARAQPGKLNMASAGVGSSSHLAGILFVSLARIDTVHVPYRGGGPMAASVVAGESQWAIAPAAALMGHVKAGRIRALAISSGARSPLLPELPTLDESGVPGYEYTSWNGFFAPSGTPRAIVMQLHGTIQKALSDPEVKQLYATQGLAPQGSTSPEDFGRFVRGDFDRIGRLMKTAGIQPE